MKHHNHKSNTEDTSKDFVEVDSSLGEKVLNDEPEVQEETVNEEVEDTKPNYGEVFNCEKVFIRESASPTSNPLGTLDKGSKVEIVGSQNEFHKVVTSTGLSGYVMKQFIVVE